MTQDFEPHFAPRFKISILISMANQNKTRQIQLVLMSKLNVQEGDKKKGRRADLR